MKITSLLSKYLYANQRLDLPGIGSFTLDPTIPPPVSGTKQLEPVADYIHFEYRSDLKEPKELIQFISNETGKMKALASSDLDSYLELAQQFLNIGKPFTFEGIGTLVKFKPGEYQFTPVPAPNTEKKKELPVRESSRHQPKDSPGNKYESFLNEPKPKEGLRKPVIAGLVLLGLALAIWGGYSISKKSDSQDKENSPATESVPIQNIATDSLDKARRDSTQLAQQAPQPKQYKYVLEVARKQRALKRYNQLITNLWKVELETKDSINYKLYMNLPVASGDTTRIKDSLHVMLGRPVYIEK